MTKIFLAGTSCDQQIASDVAKIPYLLESFYYIKEWQLPLIHTCKEFILDSGAYTFKRSASTSNVDWWQYIDRYATFVKEHKVKNYIELDIDAVVGYEQVKEFRRELEHKVGRPSIPVWRASRGMDDYLETVREYDYIAIGDLTHGMLKTQGEILKKLVQIARQNRCRVHLLGFTPKDIMSHKAYSCDSTTWLSGVRYGSYQIMTPSGVKLIPPPKGKRLNLHYTDVLRHSLHEWIKWVNYCDRQ